MRKDRYIGVYGRMLDDPKINANKTRLFVYAKVYGMTNYTKFQAYLGDLESFAKDIACDVNKLEKN